MLKENNEARKLGDISIQDISKKAMIYRTTFYTHYSDKYSLLEEYLIETWKDEILSEYNNEHKK